MYRTTIKLTEDIPVEKLNELKEIAEKAFDNREGKCSNVSAEPFKLVYEGGDDYYGCLNLGILALYDIKEFVKYIVGWHYIDEDEPEEECEEVLKSLSMKEY